SLAAPLLVLLFCSSIEPSAEEKPEEPHDSQMATIVRRGRFGERRHAWHYRTFVRRGLQRLNFTDIGKVRVEHFHRGGQPAGGCSRRRRRAARRRCALLVALG